MAGQPSRCVCHKTAIYDITVKFGNGLGLSSAVVSASCERENSSAVGREWRGRCCRRHAETAARVNRAVVAGGGRRRKKGLSAPRWGARDCTLRNRLTSVLSVATLSDFKTQAVSEFYRDIVDGSFAAKASRWLAGHRCRRDIAASSPPLH